MNNFAGSIGAPAWAHTTPTQVRKLRVQLLIAVPKLFASTGPPDAHGHYQLLRAKMSPTEATYLAVTMLFMKTVNSGYQFTDAEQSQLKGESPSVRASLASQRGSYALRIARGKSDSVSMMDVLSAADHLFDDLGMPSKSSSLLSVPEPRKFAQLMGGF